MNDCFKYDKTIINVRAVYRFYNVKHQIILSANWDHINTLAIGTSDMN